MADRAGSLMGFRVNGGPITIKVTSNDVDPEQKHNRSVRTDSGQAPRTIITQGGGILKLRGFVDPADAGMALALASVGAPGTTGQDLTAVKYLIDISESAGSRKGYTMANAKLLIAGITGQTDEGGMQEANLEIHSQDGMVYATNLT